MCHVVSFCFIRGVGTFCYVWFVVFFFFKQKTAYEMRISDWSSDVCSSDLGNWVACDADFHGKYAISDVHHLLRWKGEGAGEHRFVVARSLGGVDRKSVV